MLDMYHPLSILLMVRKIMVRPIVVSLSGAETCLLFSSLTAQVLYKPNKNKNMSGVLSTVSYPAQERLGKRFPLKWSKLEHHDQPSAP